MVDKSLNFGNQNFFFVQADETELDYDYVGSMNTKGTILLARFSKAGDSALYHAVKGDFSAVWSHRKGSGSYTYSLPNTLPELSF